MFIFQHLLPSLYSLALVLFYKKIYFFAALRHLYIHPFIENIKVNLSATGSMPMLSTKSCTLLRTMQINSENAWEFIYSQGEKN